MEESESFFLSSYFIPFQRKAFFFLSMNCFKETFLFFFILNKSHLLAFFFFTNVFA